MITREEPVSIELYRMALTAPQVKEWYREKTRVSTGGTVKEKVDALYDQLNVIQGLWGRSPQSENDRIDYDRDRENHQKAIHHLEGVAEKAVIEDALDGSIVALGFPSPEAVYPLVIPSSKWAYLELHFVEGKASGANQEYAGIRFMGREPFDNAIGWSAPSPDLKPGRLQQQIDRIIQIAKERGHDVMAIPEGEKKAILAECLKDPVLFTESGSVRAWKEASKKGKISIKDKEKYL